MPNPTRIDITALWLELAMEVNEYPSAKVAVMRWVNLFFVHGSAVQIKDVRIVERRKAA